MQLWGELKERKLVQWALAYIAFGIAVLEIMNALETPFDIPTALVRVVTVLVAAGFGVTLVLAWFHGDRGHQRVTVVEVLLLLLVAGMGAAGASVAARTEKPAAMPSAASGWKAPLAKVEQNSIAVLPFANLSGDPKDDYFSDGITEELTHALGELPGLTVVSAAQFKGQRRDPRELGGQLGVAALLQGSIQHVGSKVRIIATLVNAQTGGQIWSDRIEADASDIFAAEDKISRSVASALQVKLALGKQPTENARTEADPVAHQSYLKGRYLTSQAQRDPKAAQQAEQQFRAATRRDPDFAPAWAGLGESFLTHAHWGTMPERIARDSARMMAMKALRMDSTLPQAHVILARVADNLQTQVRELERALQLNPNLPDVRMQLAEARAALGDTREAQQEAREAARLDPLGGSSRTAFRRVMVMAGKPGEVMPTPPVPPVPGAVPVTIVTGAPSAADIAAIHADVCVQITENRWSKGNPRAAEECDKARAMSGANPLVLGRVALGYAQLGRRDDALAVLAEYEKVAGSDSRRPVMLAAVYGALGDLDRAFEVLAAVDPMQLRGYLRDPTLRPLRRDDRFSQLERRASS